MQGAAAIVGMPVATYLKWLLRNASERNASRYTSAILARLDAIEVALARLREAPRESLVTPAHAPHLRPRDLLEAKLRERGVPSSTIRQINSVLDDLQAA